MKSKIEELEQRKEELIAELSNYMWWGNEDDVDYKEEYGLEYEHLQNELNDINQRIRKLKKEVMNKELVLKDIKSLESVIKSISHTIGSDELQDIQFYLQSIKSEIKK